MSASKYTRVGDFSDDEANNKGGRSTVDTAQLDAELDAVKAVTDDHATRLDVVIRADLKLQDDVIEGHEFSASAIDYLKTALGASASFAWKGTWSASSTYTTGNMVESAGSAYIAVKDSAANQYATFTDALNDSAFDLLASKGATGTVSGAAGNLAGFDAAGQLSDIGVAATDKADRITPSAAGNVAELDAGGNLQDSGVKLSTKADKIAPSAAGNIAELDVNGNLQDSGTNVTAIHSVMPSADGVLAPHKNLKASTTSATQYNVTADELVLTDPNTGRKVLVTSVNDTPDISLSADRDSALATGWWYVWVSSDGTNVQAWFSRSATTPTDPYGYAYRGLIGAVYEEDGTGNLRRMKQFNRSVKQNYTEILTAATAVTTTAVDVSTIFPTSLGVTEGHYYLYIRQDFASTGNDGARVQFFSDIGETFAYVIHGDTVYGQGGVGYPQRSMGRLPIDSGYIYYRITNTSIVSGTVYMWGSGWTF